MVVGVAGNIIGNRNNKSVLNFNVKENPPASAWVGSKDRQFNQPKSPDYQPNRNSPTEINGRQYSGHALDRMQDRGIMPGVVEETIKYGEKFPARGNTTAHYDSKNNVQVMTNNQNGKVMTTSYGKPSTKSKRQ